MTDNQRREIAKLRSRGNGYGKIALPLLTIQPSKWRLVSVSASAAEKRYTRSSVIRQSGSVLIPAVTNSGTPTSAL